MWRLITCIIAASVGLWASYMFVPGVVASPADWKTFVLAGVAIGAIHFFIGVLGPLTLPFRILTLGLFGFIVTMASIAILNMFFTGFSAPWFFPLFWTAIIISLSNSLFSSLLIKRD